METYLFFELALILVCTKAFGLFTRKIHLPQVVGALFTGVVLGPALLNIVKPGETISILAEIGVIIIMFTAGLETDFNELRHSLKPSLAIASFGVALPLAGGFILAACFGIDVFQSIFIGVVLTATSVSITVEVLRETGKLNSKAGTAILGAAVIDDILGVIILSVIMNMGETEMGLQAVGFTLLKILLFFVFAFLFGFLSYKFFNYYTKKKGEKQRIPIFALGFCFFMAFSAEFLGVADIIGAYIAGLALSNTKSEHYIDERSTVLSYLFFSPIFFVSVGLSTTFSGISSDVVIFAVLLLAVAIVTKLAGCGLGAMLCRFSKKDSLRVGVGMIARGEVAIIVAAKGIESQLLDEKFFSAIVIVVLITTIITPVLLKRTFKDKNTDIRGKTV